MPRSSLSSSAASPNRAATEYGYIRAGAALGNGVSAIHSFHEKPDAAKAAAYLATGEYSWNAGLFLFSPKVMLEEFAHSEAIRDGALRALSHAKREGGRIILSAPHFAGIPAAPLDVAVMEKTKRGAVLPCDLGWADVGSWDEVWRLSPQDQAGNALSGAVVVDAAKNTLVVADGVKVCLAGVEDLIVIATKDAVMVLPRDRAQQVKALREAMLKMNT